MGPSRTTPTTTEVDENTDDNIGSITVAGIHIDGINLGRENDTDGEPNDDGDGNSNGEFDYHDVASRLQVDIRAALTGLAAWDEAVAIVHPVTVTRLEDHDDDTNTANITIYYSSTKSRDARDDSAEGYEEHDDPPTSHWNRVDISHLDLTGAGATEGATVTYTGLRYVLFVPRADGEDDLAPKLPMPSSPTGNVASLLGWTSSRGATSQPEFKCCPVPENDGPDGIADNADDVDAMPGWMVIKTDIDRPSGTKINQFLGHHGGHSQVLQSPVGRQHRLGIPHPRPEPAGAGQRHRHGSRL